MPMVPLTEALTLERVKPGLYHVTPNSDYCYGDWAWGGLLASLIQTAVVNHSQDHPDVRNMQIQFLRPVLRKDLSIAVSDTKKTKSSSTLHVAISQSGKECVVGYLNMVDLAMAQGPSFETGWTLDPVPAPASIVELERNESDDWVRYTVPFSKRGWFRLQSLVHFMLPYRLARQSMADEWITPTDSRNRFTNDTIGMVADLWSPFFENYNEQSTIKHARLIEIARQQKLGHSPLMEELARQGWTSPFILTTTSMELEIKRPLPREGVRWLFVRAYAKAIERGSFDAEVIIMDEQGRLVALSHQTALVAEFRADRRDSTAFAAKAKV